MNDRFIRAVKDAGVTQYRLAQQTGIPFSTINGLMNRQHSVNKCSAATLLKIAFALDADLVDLLDLYPVMDKVHGNYKGYDYEWNWNGHTMELSFMDGDKAVHIDTGNKLNIPGRERAYEATAEFKIDDYLEAKEFERRAEEVYNRLKGRGTDE